MSSFAHPNFSVVVFLLYNSVSLCPTLRMHLTAIYSYKLLLLCWAVLIKDKPKGVFSIGSKGQTDWLKEDNCLNLTNENLFSLILCFKVSLLTSYF